MQPAFSLERLDRINNNSSALFDPLLQAITQMPGVIGEFARAYPGIQDSENLIWLDEWFLSRTQSHFTGSSPTQDPLLPPSDRGSELPEASLATPARLVAVQAHYFRGFRESQPPILLDAQLVVIDGPNSSGKTSLGEAIEWLLTGALSRREGMDHGSPRELENCVANQFRPQHETTWVSATFHIEATSSAVSIVLKRELLKDYGPTRTSACTSRLLLDDRELSREDELAELDSLFGSVAPLLMQHTLRLFVESTPDKRRQYFERLLRLDHLTDLIARAVISDARLPHFPSPAGGKQLDQLQSLGQLADTQELRRALRRNPNRAAETIENQVRGALTSVANREFTDHVDSDGDYDSIRISINRAQQCTRQRSFPPLTTLRPRVQLPPEASTPDYFDRASTAATTFRDAWQAHDDARAHMGQESVDRAAIAHTLAHLLQANAIDLSVDEQTCPLCDYGDVPTLTRVRIEEIQQWAPIFEKEKTPHTLLEQARDKLSQTIAGLISDVESFLPQLPTQSELENHVAANAPELSDALAQLVEIRTNASPALLNALEAASELSSRLKAPITSGEQLDQIISSCLSTMSELEGVHQHARLYASGFSRVENAVVAAARHDPQYQVREIWLSCATNLSATVADLKWEDAKLKSQHDLSSIRDRLIEFRGSFLESRRSSFNAGMQSVWSSLRGDTYSVFSELSMPDPRGRGYLVEIEVKAKLDDGSDTRLVDALQVFSESQVNALGIAAFITRSELIGHRLLVFDDPVQSMDEEHFKTFARDVLGYLLTRGFQIVLLTHNDTFARDVSYWHYERLDYVTMAVRHSKGRGCIVDEGNRRVAERLKTAERLCADGRDDDAWKPIRLAIERLYLVSYLKHGPEDFKPVSWGQQNAEHMWNAGAGEVIERTVPGSGRRLKEILELSAAGSHDAPVRGETDLRRSIEFLRSLLNPLRIGNG